MRYIDHIRNMSDDQLAYFLNAIQPEITLWSLAMTRTLSRKPYNGQDALNGTNGDILGTTEQTHEAVEMAVKALLALPSVDAINVVQCEKCKHYNNIDFYCYYHGSMCFKPNDYCPYGRVRDNG